MQRQPSRTSIYRLSGSTVRAIISPLVYGQLTIRRKVISDFVPLWHTMCRVQATFLHTSCMKVTYVLRSHVGRVSATADKRAYAVGSDVCDTDFAPYTV